MTDTTDPLRVTMDFTAAGRLRLALWQGKPRQADSHVDIHLHASVNQLVGLLAQSAAQDAELLVLPELFLGGYSTDRDALIPLSPGGPMIQAIAAAAKAHSIAVVFGFPERGVDSNGRVMARADDGRPVVYNSCIAIDRDGATVSVFRKCHLFGASEKAAFVPGDRLGEVFTVAGYRAAMLICYDVEFPEAVRKCAAGGAELVLVPTANFVPFDLSNRLVVKCRALENHIFVAYTNWGEFTNGQGVQFNGQSSVTAPDGTAIIEWAPGDEDGIRTAELHRHEQTGEDNYLTDRRPELYGIV